MSNTSKPVDTLPVMKMQSQAEDAEGDYEEEDQGTEVSVQAGQTPHEETYKANAVHGEKEREDKGEVSSEDEVNRTSRKRKRTRSSRQSRKLKVEESDVASEVESAASQSSGAEAPWEAEEEEANTVEGESADPNRCVFCHLNEDEDPAEEFEEMLNCAACGDHGRLMGSISWGDAYERCSTSTMHPRQRYVFLRRTAGIMEMSRLCRKECRA